MQLKLREIDLLVKIDQHCSNERESRGSRVPDKQKTQPNNLQLCPAIKIQSFLNGMFI